MPRRPPALDMESICLTSAPLSTRSFRLSRSSLGLETVRWRRLIASSSKYLGSRSLESRCFATEVFLFAIAIRSGVTPLSVSAQGSAPVFTRSLTRDERVEEEIQCKSVLPQISVWSTEARYSRRTLAVAVDPTSTQMFKGRLPNFVACS
ncbi:hypothetical protein BDW74DRAFT_152881 [Aspergillus multicolor]|uniref:uncharacterized protein n=1 Tax=Aspergillus multicolor TaxID=41759 RepID=UPI003CCE2C26